MLVKYFKKPQKATKYNWQQDSSDEEQQEEEIPEYFVNDSKYLNDPDYGRKKLAFEMELYWNRDGQKAYLDDINNCKKHKYLEEYENQANHSTEQRANLFDCLKEYSKTEKLSQDNTWYCRKCKDHVQALKTIELQKTPPVLFINLKRFKSKSGSYFKDKLDDEVYFPLEDLDVSEFVINNLDGDGQPKESIKYELYAVSNHYGNLGFGHYTAYARNYITGKWYDFDDSSVDEVSPDKVISSAAYNLFYIRKDLVDNDDLTIQNTVDSEAFIAEMNSIRLKEEAEAKALEAQQEAEQPKPVPLNEQEESKQMQENDNYESAPSPPMTDEQIAMNNMEAGYAYVPQDGYDQLSDNDIDSVQSED